MTKKSIYADLIENVCKKDRQAGNRLIQPGVTLECKYMMPGGVLKIKSALSVLLGLLQKHTCSFVDIWKMWKHFAQH